MREALIVWGGWSGHEPEQGAHIVAEMLEEGFKVYIENTTEAFADPAIADMSLIVPIVTMSKIEKEEVENLTAAVRGGVGLAGYHGGMCDAFRDASTISSCAAASGSPIPAMSSTTGSTSRRPTIRSCRGCPASPTAPSNITCTSILRTRCWRRHFLGRTRAVDRRAS